MSCITTAVEEVPHMYLYGCVKKLGVVLPTVGSVFKRQLYINFAQP
ncbi:hypothetical protein CLOSTMETH_02071 [[Clostridium] methylpentosum DSM 5476]|uniref:Uncharacterized protein n=1 Tax=[Clostridium] methylpentosum DSM 5476 TaxID=537013 RepID=C0EDZ2_9FIRM|nr:hypothetical protein CLOSTMETH_02071 [[Clostridium] methylpentosum DSM 5476]